MKTILSFLKSGFLWINILISTVLIVLICYIVFWQLDVYTRHGESVDVPDLSKMFVEEAELILKERGLGYEVIDSVYIKEMKGGEIVEQSPMAGTKVKRDRKIYVIINCKERKKIQLPNLVGESRRKVQSNLKTLGFNVDSIKYESSEFNEEVLALLYNGKSLSAGERVPEGSRIVLVVGQNDRSIEVVVPSFEGMTLAEAKKTIEEYHLGFGAAYFDEVPVDATDTLNYKVYRQTPEAGLSVFGGKSVELMLTKGEHEEDEIFF